MWAHYLRVCSLLACGLTAYICYLFYSPVKLEPKKNMLETLLKDNLEQRRDEVKKVWNLLTLFEE